jgi:hypothetical protein
LSSSSRLAVHRDHAGNDPTTIFLLDGLRAMTWPRRLESRVMPRLQIVTGAFNVATLRRGIKRLVTSPQNNLASWRLIIPAASAAASTAPGPRVAAQLRRARRPRRRTFCGRPPLSLAVWVRALTTGSHQDDEGSSSRRASLRRGHGFIAADESGGFVHVPETMFVVVRARDHGDETKGTPLLLAGSLAVSARKMEQRRNRMAGDLISTVGTGEASRCCMRILLESKPCCVLPLLESNPC